MKKYLLLFISIIMLCGCSSRINQNDGKERFYLSDEYYNEGKYIQIDKDNLSKLSNDSYILFVYNNYCSLPIPCDEVFETTMKKYNLDVLSITFKDFKETAFYETVKYAPSIIIVNKGKIVDYLKADEDGDLEKYQDSEVFAKWLDNYIYFSK